MSSRSRGLLGADEERCEVPAFFEQIQRRCDFGRVGVADADPTDERRERAVELRLADPAELGVDPRRFFGLDAVQIFRRGVEVEDRAAAAQSSSHVTRV